MSTSTIRPSGYRPCACRDCFEIAIGSDGAMCHHCEDAGCPGDRECQASTAYGGELEPESQPEPPAADRHAGVLRAMTEAAHTGREAITRACQAKGFYIVSNGTYDPRLLIPRLVATLIVLTPTAQVTLLAPDSSFRTLTEEALADEQHPYWAGADAERLVADLTMALHAAAPAGFMFTAEGAWHNMGFFPL